MVPQQKHRYSTLSHYWVTLNIKNPSCLVALVFFSFALWDCYTFPSNESQNTKTKINVLCLTLRALAPFGAFLKALQFFAPRSFHQRFFSLCITYHWFFVLSLMILYYLITLKELLESSTTGSSACAIPTIGVLYLHTNYILF